MFSEVTEKDPKQLDHYGFSTILSRAQKSKHAQAIVVQVVPPKRQKESGPLRESNPGPPAPKAGIIPLNQVDSTHRAKKLVDNPKIFCKMSEVGPTIRRLDMMTPTPLKSKGYNNSKNFDS